MRFSNLNHYCVLLPLLFVVWISFSSSGTVTAFLLPKPPLFLSSFQTKKNGSHLLQNRSTTKTTTTSLRLSNIPTTRSNGKQPPTKYQNNNKNNNSRISLPKGRGGRGGYQQEHIILNKQIAHCENAPEILNLLASTKDSLTVPGGGGILNAVNFSTSLHKIAKEISYSKRKRRDNPSKNRNNYRNNRGGDDDDDEDVTKDAKFAFLICSVSEALATHRISSSSSSWGKKKEIMVDSSVHNNQLPIIEFDSRSLSSISWALSKLELVPPQSVLPVELTKEATSDRVLEQASKVRSLVDIEIKAQSKKKKTDLRSTTTQQQQHHPSDPPTWMLDLSILCGMIQDTISYRVLKSAQHPKKQLQLQLQAYSNLLWALTTSQREHQEVVHCIISGMLQRMKDLTVNRSQYHKFETQHISKILWSFSKIGIRHPKLFRMFGEYLVGNEDRRRTSQHQPGSHHHALQDFSPKQLSSTAYAYARLGMKHNELLQSAEEQLLTRSQRFLQGQRDRTTQFTGQNIANLIWSFGTLNVSYNGLLRDVEPYIVEMCKDNQGRLTVASITRYMNQQNLANIAWACVVFGDYPPQLIKILYMGLLGVGENPDPVFMTQIHGEGGIHKSAMRSLVYLQIARDLDDDPTNGLVLPPDFPSAWESSPRFSNGRDVLGFDLLELKSSTIQRDVSNSFNRIGFSHVQKHVIRMDSLAEGHGIQMGAVPTEIFSLDIADVNAKIGIEVDGPFHFISQIDKVPQQQLEGDMQMIVDKTDYKANWNVESCEMNGSTCLKHRLMEGLGWRIIHIPFWEWNALEGDPVLEETYCRNVLELQ